MFRNLLALMLLLVPVSAFAQTFDLTLNDASAQLRLSKTLNQDEFGATVPNVRFLFNDAAEDDATVKLLSGGLHFVGEPGNTPGIQIEIGGDIIGAVVSPEGNNEDAELLALGVTGLLTVAPPAFNGFSIFAGVTYAPKVLSFADCERMTEVVAGVRYPVTPKIKVQLVYQNIGVDFDGGGDGELDSDLRFGFLAHF